jgi:hypothetical protein
MKDRWIVLEDEFAVVLTLRELQNLNDRFRSLIPNRKSFPRQVTMEPLHPEALMEEIRRRAFALYEERGREPGNAEQDWLRAEAEILARRRADDEAVAA